MSQNMKYTNANLHIVTLSLSVSSICFFFGLYRSYKVLEFGDSWVKQAQDFNLKSRVVILNPTHNISQN